MYFLYKNTNTNTAIKNRTVIEVIFFLNLINKI